jgi:cell division protein FtsQ
VVLAVLAAVAYGITRSPLLAVDTVTVVGTAHLTPAQVEAAAGVHEGDAMVWVDAGNAISRVKALPYVRDVTIEREWPHTVRIAVHERTAAAWIDGAGAKTVVDSTGRVLETVAAPPGLPQLLGAKVVPPPGGTVDAAPAAKVAGALTALAVGGAASVQDTPDHGVVVHMASGPELRLGPATAVAVKLRAALAVLGAMQDAPPAYVDVSVPTNPVAG